MPAPIRNGHRRRELRARVLRTETNCALCGEIVDKTLVNPDPMAPVVDEDIPRIRGGSPYDRNNCHLMHRSCNRWKATMTLAEAKAKREHPYLDPPQIKASPGW